MSPCSWGWSGLDRVLLGERSVVPIRGGDPYADAVTIASQALSPCSWGWSGNRTEEHSSDRVLSPCSWGWSDGQISFSGHLLCQHLGRTNCLLPLTEEAVDCDPPQSLSFCLTRTHVMLASVIMLVALWRSTEKLNDANRSHYPNPMECEDEANPSQSW